MTLDILSDLGQKSLKDEQDIALWLKKKNVDYIQTPKDTHAKIDAVLSRDNSIVGVAESKCRYGESSQTFRTKFKNEWLITEEKIVKAQEIADLLCVPLYGFLYLVSSNELIIVNLTTAKRKTAYTETSRCINGGKITLLNAFVDLDGSPIYKNIRKTS